MNRNMDTLELLKKARMYCGAIGRSHANDDYL